MANILGTVIVLIAIAITVYSYTVMKETLKKE